MNWFFWIVFFAGFLFLLLVMGLIADRADRLYFTVERIVEGKEARQNDKGQAGVR